MARLANLFGIPKVDNIQSAFKFAKIKCISRNCEEFQNENTSCSLSGFKNNASRRSVLCIGIASAIAVFQEVKQSLAEGDGANNGLWLDGPLPGLPPVLNQIANEETGTRTFLKKGIFMANIGVKGSAYRLKKYSFDLMAMGDLIGQDAWNYIRRYLRLKGTVMYYDFDKVISAASDTDKPPLLNLANRLFDNFERLQEAVKLKDLPLTESCYEDTTVILQEVMDRMA